MHRRWLGKPTNPNPKLDPSAFAFSLGVATLCISREDEDVLDHSDCRSLVSLGESGIDIVSVHWPLPLTDPATLFREDPNSALLACEVRLRKLRFSEQLDHLADVVDSFSPSHPNHSHFPPSPAPALSPSPSTPSLPLKWMPRIIIDIAILDAKARLWYNDLVHPAASPPFLFQIASDQFTLNLNSSFVDRSASAPKGSPTSSEASSFSQSLPTIPLKLVYTGAAYLSPSSVTLTILSEDEVLGVQRDDESERSVTLSVLPSNTSFLDPGGITPRSSSASTFSVSSKLGSYSCGLLDVAPIEIAIQGQCLSSLTEATEGHPEQVRFDPQNFVTDVRLRIEAVVVDLRDMQVAAPLQRLCDILNTQNNTSPTLSSSRDPEASQPKFSLPSGLLVYAWIGGIHLAATDVDINPDIGPRTNLSRGVAVSSGIVLEYCSLIAPNQTPVDRQDKPSFGLMSQSPREEFGLEKDIYSDAFAIAHQIRDQGRGGRSALIRVALVDTRVWSIIASDHHHPDFPEIENEEDHRGRRVDKRIILEIPRIQVRGLATAKAGSTGGDTKHMNISVDASRVFGHFTLSHAYGALLAAARISRLTSKRARPPSSDSHTSSSSLVTAQIRIDDIQALAELPGEERVYVRSTLFVLEHAPEVLSGKAQTLMVWVPSAQRVLKGKWEELGRLKSWSFEVVLPKSRKSVSEVHVAIDMQALRLCLPYEYVFNQLIHGATVGFKTMKHLKHCISERRYESMGLPPAEPPKTLPSISIKASSVSIEAADDPFEYQLNQNWRIGLEEQRARLERNLAFDAKVEAIRQTQGSQRADGPTSRVTFDWKFDSSHTVNEDDAWHRLQLYSSQSWVRRCLSTSNEKERSEAVYLRPMKGMSSRVPVWSIIDVHEAEKRVPLLRISFRDLDVEISPPDFGGDTGRQAFMHDLGSGLPTSTLFTLLLPLHLHWRAKAARITIRDYPLPMLDVPPHSNKNRFAWDFSTDFVAAEELGPPSTVMFVPSVVTPAQDGIPSFAISVPKTLNPVKTYAEPAVVIDSSGTTDLSWGVSLNPGVADVMQAFDRVTSPPHDPSPPVGFWDKLRLSFHWRLKASFVEQLHIHLKGVYPSACLVATVGALTFDII